MKTNSSMNGINALACLKFKLFLIFTILLLFTNSNKVIGQDCGPLSAYSIKVVGNTLVFTAEMPNIPSASYYWGWDNGTTTNEQEGNQMIVNMSVFSSSTPTWVRLLVTTPFDEQMCNEAVYVSYNACEPAGFTYDAMGCLVAFSFDSDPTVLSQTWNFGDNSSEVCDESFPVHEYSTSGTYEVCHATVTKLSPFTNNIFICCAPVSINCINPLCTPDFEFDEIESCCQLEICFSSEYSLGEHEWDFGDGTTSNLPNPCHIFRNINTCPGETPSVSVNHSITCDGITLSQTQIIEFESEGIYVGETNQITSIQNVVSSINGQLLFPGESINSKDIHIEGELLIDKPEFTFNNVDICMVNGSGINVGDETGIINFLRIYDSNIDNAPNCSIWRSIEVFGDGFLDLTLSTIKDALYGIRSMEDNATIDLSNNEFINNFVGVYIQDNIIIPEFGGNTFSFNGFLDPIGGLTLDQDFNNITYLQQRAYSGVYTQCNDCFFEIAEDNQINTFKNLANGIRMTNTNANLNQCTFNDIATGPYGSFGGSSIYFNSGTGMNILENLGNTFSDCEIGVTAIAGGPNTLVASVENEMSNMDIGHQIISAGSFEAKINDNKIEATEYAIGFTNNSGNSSSIDIRNNEINIIAEDALGIWLNDNMNGVTHNIDVIANDPINVIVGYNGIFLNNFRGADIESNNINISLTNAFVSGIRIEGGGENDIRCNTINGEFQDGNGDESFGIRSLYSAENTFVSNHTNGTWRGINFVGMCNASIVTCNIMEDNGIGLLYWTTAITGSQTAFRNFWLGNFSEEKAHHLGIQSIYALSPFTRVVGTSSDPFPQVSPSFGWFFPGSAPFCIICPEYELAPKDEIQKIDLKIATTGFTFDSYEDGYNWIAEQQLFYKLNKNPKLVDQNDEVLNFKNSRTASALGELYKVAEDTKNLYAITPQTGQEIDNVKDKLMLNLESLSEINKEIKDSPGNIKNLIPIRSKTLNALYNVKEDWTKIYTNWRMIRTNQIDFVLEDLSNVQTQNSFDGNEKKVDEILLKTIASDIPATLTQKEQVRRIAESCYLEGGSVVFQARSLYYSWTGNWIEGEECEGSNSKRENLDNRLNQERENNTLFGYPNPANISFNFEYKIEEIDAEEDYSIELRNNLGQLVRSYLIDPNLEKLTISTGHLSEGLYFGQLLKGSKNLHSLKIIVQH